MTKDALSCPVKISFKKMNVSRSTRKTNDLFHGAQTNYQIYIFWDILLTNGQTNKQDRKYILLGLSNRQRTQKRFKEIVQKRLLEYIFKQSDLNMDFRAESLSSLPEKWYHVFMETLSLSVNEMFEKSPFSKPG